MPSNWNWTCSADKLRTAFMICIISISIGIYLKDYALPYIQETVNRENFDTAIGILSARENFEERAAVRDTWLKYITENETLKNSVAYKFLVGTKDCHVPSQDRLNPYSCEWDPFIKAAQDDNIFAYRVPHEDRAEVAVTVGPLGLDFQVQHPIVITNLGVYDSASDGIKGQVQVSIYDRIKKEQIVWTYFNGSGSEYLQNEFRFKAVDQYMLPEGFQGSLVIDGLAEEDLVVRQKQNCFTDDGGGLVIFKKVYRRGLLPRSFPEIVDKHRNSSCFTLAGTFVYKPFGDSIVKNASLVASERLGRLEQRLEEMKSIDEKLEAECLKFNDILLIDVEEVYRNLPAKILQFYKWVSHKLEFKFTLKTDDDCFLNIPRIVEIIDEEKLSEIPKLWWSRFRLNWPLDHYGKWTEEDYTALVYPAFACGAGNLLSSDLVHWIAENHDNLKTFQGEDVSVGIWLSPLSPTLLDDYRWSCFQDCRHNMLSSPNYSPDELRGMFKKFKTCENHCHCVEY